MYDESWVEKLYRGFTRNLTRSFQFVCYVDRIRNFSEPAIQQRCLKSHTPGYSDCIQPYELGVPMILIGLDSIICGNVDELADYCLQSTVIGLPRDPYAPERACNGVALVPEGFDHVYHRHNGENDMDWMRKQPHQMLDDLFPGKIVSYKGRVKNTGVGEASIVYFHGQEKPHELQNLPLIQHHWR